jgi:hypothetical protein
LKREAQKRNFDKKEMSKKIHVTRNLAFKDKESESYFCKHVLAGRLGSLIVFHDA